MTRNTDDLQYAGFWVRVGASLIDTILLALVTTPLLVAIYGWAGLDYGYAVRSTGFVDILVTWILPVVAVIWFWLTCFSCWKHVICAQLRASILKLTQHLTKSSKHRFNEAIGSPSFCTSTSSATFFAKMPPHSH